MADKEKPTDKQKPTQTPAQQLSEDETSKVVGGMLPRGADSCKETSDSGMMGCPG